MPGVVELDLVKRGSRMSMGDILATAPNSRRGSTISVRNQRSAGATVLANEFSSVYQRWTVSRRIPMLVGKHERVLAIDGDYIHIMPPEQRSMFDTSVKTASYHIGSVVSCKQNRKMPIKFKLVVFRDRDMKTYDFDAASKQETDEIVTKINFLMRLNQGEVQPNST
jgi:hypothetical protein